MRILIIALLLAAIVPASAQRNSFSRVPETKKPDAQMDFGPPSRTIKLYDKETGDQVATATFSQRAIYFHNMEGQHVATLARKPDNTVGAWDRNGNPMDPTALPSLK